VPTDNITVVHADQVIDMHESPTKALKEKQRSSISIGFHLLASGKTDAFISAGNTGAMLVGALFSIKAIEGVLRPTISSVIPKENGKTGLILDVVKCGLQTRTTKPVCRDGVRNVQQILGIEKAKGCVTERRRSKR
jgi:glycerol-3-phosphate acyltransferase PlsX